MALHICVCGGGGVILNNKDVLQKSVLSGRIKNNYNQSNLIKIIIFKNITVINRSI